MPGYTLIEQSQLSPNREAGVSPHADVYGFLDFLRELAQADFPFSRFSALRLVGLEETLFAARPDEREIAQQIHHRLQQAAASLEQGLLSVQVVFQGSLRRGDSLWVEFRGARLPIDVIFDSPLISTDSRGNRYCRVNFNLTSPAA